MVIKLGQKVRDTITGLEGIAVTRTEYLYGCIRIGVQSTQLKDGKPLDWVSFDEPQLELVDDTPKAAPSMRTHGDWPTVGPAPDPPR